MREFLGLPLPMWLLVNLVAAAYMTGVIWFVQLVHYPLLAKVGPAEFVAYERQHTRRTGWVVAGPMLVELAAAFCLAYLARGTFLASAAYFAFALVLVIWASTFGLQVPCHNRLEKNFEPETWARLVTTNWIRTVALSGRTAVLLWMLVRILRLR